MATKENILNILSNCIFDDKVCSDTFEQNILANLPIDFCYDYDDGATKLVIIPQGAEYVIKIPFTGYYDSDGCYKNFNKANKLANFSWNYCTTECILYHQAKLRAVEKAFAKQRVIGTVENHPIYIQERVDVFDDVSSFGSEEEKAKIANYCHKHQICLLPDECVFWQRDAIEYYGLKQFNKIMNFIMEAEIDDLYRRNLGYVGNRPVILDWGGYLEE